jgi:hypothetical protein
MRASSFIVALCICTAAAYGQSLGDSIQKYEKQLRENPRNSLAHYLVSEIYFQQVNYQTAANEFRESLNGNLQPRWVEVWSHLGLAKIFELSGQHDRAVNEYRLAARTHDNTKGAQEVVMAYLKQQNVAPENNQILGHWCFSGNAIMQSGLPFSVYTSAQFEPILGPNNTVIGLKPGSGDYNADGYDYDQPNAPAFGNYVSVSRSAFIKGLFPVSAFSVPALGREGNLGRNTFDGPGLAQVNVNVVKTIHIPWFIGEEGATIEIRSEIFNVLNRVNLNNPISDLSSGLFGLSTSQKSPRAARFGLRIAF